MPNIYKSKKWLPLFLIPAFLFMAVYLYYPFFMNILNSFQSIRTLGLAAGEWNDPWYTNYVMLFQDAEVWTSLKNTCIMIVVTLVVQVGLALVLALMVDNVRHGTQFFRTVYFFPIVISATALGLLFNLIVLYDKGMLNQFLELFGKTTLTDWKDESHALMTMMLPVAWQYVGFYFVIIETGLNIIPEELYESARVDGANPFVTFFKITLPYMLFVTTPYLITSFTGNINNFNVIYLTSTGLPRAVGSTAGDTDLLITWLYKLTIDNQYYDVGAVIGIMTFVTLSIASLLTFRFSGSYRNEEGFR